MMAINMCAKLNLAIHHVGILTNLFKKPTSMAKLDIGSMERMQHYLQRKGTSC